jgi:hypothetical protein
VTATWIIAARHFGQSAEWAKAFINRRPAKPGSLRADAKQVVFTPRRRDPAALGAGPAAADYDFSAEAANGGASCIYFFCAFLQLFFAPFQSQALFAVQSACVLRALQVLSWAWAAVAKELATTTKLMAKTRITFRIGFLLEVGTTV